MVLINKHISWQFPSLGEDINDLSITKIVK